MALLQAMLALKELQESLQVDPAVAKSIGVADKLVLQRAYLLRPDRGKGLADLPCIINLPDASTDIGGLGQKNEESRYSVQMDFYAPNSDVGPLMALAFFDLLSHELRRQRRSDLRIGGTVEGDLAVRAERPLLETLEWNGLGYPGFHLFLDFTCFEDLTP